MMEPQYRIVLADLDIPFTRLVAFFVKATLAAIPAAIIVLVVLRIIGFLIAGALNNIYFR